jgi:lipopolysaccharide export system permease protein
VIIEVFVLSVPFIVAVTLPMAVLVAVLYAFSHLGADNEITAMKASGISVGRILKPVLLGAMAVALLSLVWNDQVLPRSNHRLRSLLTDIQRKKPSFTLREQVINEVVAGQFFLRAARIDPATNRLKDVSIYDLGDVERRRVITADSGRMAYTPGGRDLYLTLLDGEIREVKRTEPGHFDRTFFHTNVIRVAGVGNTLERTINDTYRGDRELTICGMERVVARSRWEIQQGRLTAQRVVQDDLRRAAGLAVRPYSDSARDTSAVVSLYCRGLKALAGLFTPDSAHAATITEAAAPQQRAETSLPVAEEDARVQSALFREASYSVEIQKKLAISAACIVFALVGVPVALRFPRGGIGMVIGMSLAVFTIYYVGLIGGEELGDRLVVSPFLAMWVPNILFAIVGVIGLWVVRSQGSTARGGDWADFRDALLGWLPRRRRRNRA